MFETTHRDVLFVLLALGFAGTFFFSKHRMRSAFIFFICTLGLGYRTFPLTQALRIHPAEVVLWTLFLCWLGQPRPWQGKKANIWLPGWLWVFMPFCMLAWIPAPENPFPWDVKLSEFRNFVVLVPLLLVTPAVLAKRANWRTVVLSMYCVGVWIAGMGIVEYIFPGIATLLSGFVSDPSAMVAADGFARASFAFYGSPVAVNVCILQLPLAILLWRWWPAAWPRVITLSGVVLQIAAIYISGSRSIWLLMGVQLLLFAVLARHYFLGAIVLLFGLVGYEALPEVAQMRLHSLDMVLQGHPIDSSGVERWERAMVAFRDIWEWPMGRGWSAAGWVHSDLLQVAANLGIVPGIIFLAGYLTTLCRLGMQVWAHAPESEEGALDLSLFLSFVAAGVILTLQCVVVLPHLVLPVWLVWALVETRLWQTASLPKEAAKRNGRDWSALKYRRTRSRATA
jgi:hypothetical protein